MATSTCAVCWEPLASKAPGGDDGGDGDAQRCVLPCCHREEATTAVCKGCVRLLCAASSGVAKCPVCRAALTYDAERGEAKLADDRLGTCAVCRQSPRILTDARTQTCEACSFGIRHPLVYECARCHGTQRIPHPMWRYQPSPAEFSTATWACHVGAARGCTYTFWRVVPGDLPKVPSFDLPDGWAEERERFLAEIRHARRAEIAGQQNQQSRSGILATVASFAGGLATGLFGHSGSGDATRNQ